MAVHVHGPGASGNHPWRLLMLMQGCLKTWHLGSNVELLPSLLPQNSALITLGSLAATPSFRRLLKPPSSSLDSSLVAPKSLITSWSEGLSNPFSHREDEVWALDLGSKAKPERSRGCPPAHRTPGWGSKHRCGSRDKEWSG